MADQLTPLKDITREVRTRTIPLGEGKSALIRRHYDAPVEEVWSACTEPARIGVWFIPPKGDLREGGSYVLEGHARGEILHCEAPRRLTLSWIYEDNPASEVELRLSPGTSGTELELEHAMVTEEMADGLAQAGVGWEPALDYLERYLRGELPDEPQPSQEWEPTPEEMERMGESQQLWTEVIEAALGKGR